MKLARFLPLFLLSAASLAAPDGNRLTYLDSSDPFYPNLGLARFTTPQWIGEPGVEAAVILSIDDLKVTARYETYLRPILDRLKQIDGHAPFSIMCNDSPPDDPQFAAWLKEGVDLEVHTLTHPCPLLGKDGFESAAHNYHGSVDLLASIPGNLPVAFRMPCCDSMNSASPRFFSEIFSRTSPQGHWLAIDSSVMHLFTPRDTSLPRDLVVEGDHERFRKYFPLELAPPRKVTFGAFAGYIEDYPYPYVIDHVCWEFPCAVPSDWEAFNTHGAKNPATLADWKAALDATVLKQGVMTTILHPYGWSSPEQIIEFIDYAVSKYGPKVKFLTFREALARIEKNALGGETLRNANGGDNGVRLLDLDGDGFMDVVIGNDHKQVTRLWEPFQWKLPNKPDAPWRDQIDEVPRWHEISTPTHLVWTKSDGPSDTGVKFGVIRTSEIPPMLVRDVSGTTVRRTSLPKPVMLSRGPFPGAWEFDGKSWQEAPELLRGLEDLPPDRLGIDSGVRLRDFDHDGHCELLISNPERNAIYGWSDSAGRWQLLDYALPKGVSLVNSRGEDNGLRFFDLNGDGFEDVLFSNEHEYAIHLWAGHVRENLGWKRGWPHEVTHAARGEKPGAHDIPPIVRDGRNNGAWVHDGHLVLQNEETMALDDHTFRRSFSDLIAFEMPPAKSPEDSLATIQVRPGFKVDLVAAEPLIEDPIAIDWDAQGRLWVLEMRDYPLGLDGKGQPGGRIRVLEDTHGDGHYDKSTIFLDDIPFPSGFAPWRNGVIVAASPEIFFAADTDGDGKADVHQVLFTGFKPGNQQHRLNGFDWGLDGWLYGANGDSGGKVKSTITGREVDISGRDFRFRPDSGEFETVSGGSQYGRHRDDWGEWFGNYNSAWLWHFTVPEHYLIRNPKLALKSVKRVLANDSDPLRVFPISFTLPRFNQPDTVGFVTSANSATPYRDQLFGPDFETSVFISEPVYNVVHREVLSPDGATFTSLRAEGEHDREFLASSDNWFRPTRLKVGPDGALYIPDMYRAVLEHPEWIPPETLSRLDVRAGADKGRIYRVRPENAVLPPPPNLAKLDAAGLASALDSPSGWQRDTAQRLLYEREDKGSVPAIKRLAGGAANPKVRLQALATLDLLKALDPETIMAALRDKHPGVRAEALRLSESLAGNSPALLDAVTALENDPDFSVRRQLAFSLGAWHEPAATDALGRLAAKEGDNEQMRPAILSSVGPESPLMASLNARAAKPAAPAALPKVAAAPNISRAKVAESYAGVAGLHGDPVHGHEIYRQTCSICHRLKGEGSELGPDLGTVADKPFDWLLTAIFDPNAAVEVRYTVHRITTKAGGEVIGLIVAETANNLTVRMPGGVEQTVLRTEIKDRAPLGRSLMPDGLEAVLKQQDVADVISWIRAK